jgi:ATP-dependent metalloprotease
MRAQLWRTVRTLGIAFLVLSGLGALMEDKGLSRGVLANPDMTPTVESTTKFADVKGVDEAKVIYVLPFFVFLSLIT